MIRLMCVASALLLVLLSLSSARGSAGLPTFHNGGTDNLLRRERRHLID